MSFYRLLVLAVSTGAIWTGCGVPPVEESLSQPLGETTADRPSYIERLAFYACNRSRMDPAATGWPSYPAVAPLLWADELAQSSRAHSQDMHDTPCFQHPSCDGTDPFVRIKTYWTMPYASLAENIMEGINDGQQAIQNWINEVGASPGETGHRDNMFDKLYHQTHVGLGYVSGGKMQGITGYWTQDFAGVSPSPAIPPIPAGSHWPESAVAGQPINFGAIFYDAGGAKPDSVSVVLDGVATPLALTHGPVSAGSYEGIATITQGCHRYYFRALVGGVGSIYPDAGTLGVASSDVTEGSCVSYMAGGVSTDPTMSGGTGMYGESGCAIGGGANSPAPWTLMIALVLLLSRRRIAAIIK